MEVTNISYIGTEDDYVYDLETEEGTYLGGDDILLKNTDSVMIKFDVPITEYKDTNGKIQTDDYMKKHFELAKITADRITKVFKNPIKLEFEKVMYPYFLLEKKRYIYIVRIMCKKYGCVMTGEESDLIPMCDSCLVAHTVPETIEKSVDLQIKNIEKEMEELEDLDDLQEDDEEYEEIQEIAREEEKDLMGEGHEYGISKIDVIDYKGIPLTRRDTCAYVKKVYLEILKISMLEFIPGSEEIAINKAVNHARLCFEKLIRGQIDKKLLTLSKSLRGNYKVRPKYKGSVTKTAAQQKKEITDITTSIKWYNSFCTWCQEECPDPEFTSNKKCPSCNKCTEVSKCALCMHSLVTVTSAHVYVAKFIRFKNPADHLKPPSRIPFLFIEKDGYNKNTKQCEIACHPDYMNGKKINHMYYFEHQMKEPISQIINLLRTNENTVQFDCRDLYESVVHEVKMGKTGQKKLNIVRKN